MKFKLISKFKPAGDQPKAIKQLVEGIKKNYKHQVLLGVTGSGKTFTLANVIAKVQKPTLVISHNKTLAAQLYSEFKEFFPNNAVEYFISYYDYYQPEAYLPETDTYIEKDASINEQIDRLRLKATTSLLSRDDVIVVASVSCIYNIGSPEDFKNLCVYIEVGKKISMDFLTSELVKIRYERNNIDFTRNKFRYQGDIIDIWPSYLENFIRVKIKDDEIVYIKELKPLTNEVIREHTKFYIYPASHFVTTSPKFEEALKNIRKELDERVEFFKSQGKLLEAERIYRRTMNDLELLETTGFCHGIENYSRHLSGRKPGERPGCLIDYFPKDFLCIIDESHVTIPQIYGMYEGDRSRKQTLVDYGFRLPSALDNRPLKFDEFLSLLNYVIYSSATPSEWEINISKGRVVEQIVRPTGLVDPPVYIRSSSSQVEDVKKEIKIVVKNKERVLVNTLTKRTAEDLAEYLASEGYRVRYIHSDLDALTRINIIKDLRKGEFDVLVGVNLLREGLDLPEVSLVCILDADREGFLRNETTLIQLAGRAARNINSRIILYADKITNSIKKAIEEMERRRKIQMEYNKKHNITPKSIVKSVKELEEFQYMAKNKHISEIRDIKIEYINKDNIDKIIKFLGEEMKKSAEVLDFETAIMYREKIKQLKEMKIS
ncbi:MAG: excinuclease ABC subunit UvrB [Elusimicrobiota bacterium]|nr:excinuclease ABC subunit UvrB [Endomicrobiia bacterium]MDW8164904.1 excinuclease ABC subunit UvrB [Elusimicrobiota bacterium]